MREWVRVRAREDSADGGLHALTGCLLSSSAPQTLASGMIGKHRKAALEDPYPDEDELAHLLSEARRRGEDIDPGLLADVEFHTQRLAKFWGAERE